MANPEHVAIVRDGKAALDTWRAENPDTRLDLRIADLRGLAKQEGRQIQALVEEAITALIEQRRQGTVRPHVLGAYQKSHARYAPLYKKLAE